MRARILRKTVWPKRSANIVKYLLVVSLSAFKTKLTAVGATRTFNVNMLPNSDREIYIQALVHPVCVTHNTHHKGQRAHFMTVKTNSVCFIFSVWCVEHWLFSSGVQTPCWRSKSVLFLPFTHTSFFIFGIPFPSVTESLFVLRCLFKWSHRPGLRRQAIPL